MQGNTTMLKDRKSRAEQKRQKVIEIELEVPVSLKVFSPAGEEPKEVNAEVLSFNENGILFLTEKALKEGSFINLSINFKGLGLLDDILGKVKRVEKSEEDDFYIGVELYSREQIEAEASSGLFPEKMESFEVKLKKGLMEFFNRAKEQRKKSDSAQDKDSVLV